MTARIDPAAVTPELLGLTRRLGLPERDLVILAEGNTSELVDPTTMVVKASGSSMAEAGPEDFVSVDVPRLLELLRSPEADQHALTTALTAGKAGGRTVRASIESLVHAAVRAFGTARFVAHTHPTQVVALLASAEAEQAFAEPVYSEEFMILGRSMYVPYAQPGMELGRVFLAELDSYVQRNGELPSLVLLGNHGIVAISDTAAGAEAISLMAVKSARVRLGARAAGGVAPLSPETIAGYFDRPDFRERRATLAGTSG
ncbi:class II aldolase/adducin family protein [Microbacterium sp. zg.Y625]|uniref:class II aldolase/adducin family protein n=1 Tax=Microbacterium jiangjiandongii TaxID=3049071 RepID=UPI00214ADBC7|nr:MULTISPECIES: class II aldolase/adducin family protein [unclassified Microbacterium]MCR2792290.1 class II aldolase/adducin family protein [Microbacterium sp. zg.Y625]WIM25086.1 class II aldolase/adducin family protein [Microbacterium sp. zg-Y625]